MAVLARLGAHHHGVFAAHVVNGNWTNDGVGNFSDHVKVGKTRFDHDDVGALRLVEVGLEHRFFVAGAGVHLMGRSVAKFGA